MNAEWRWLMMSNFYKYFKENMDSLGLPAPVYLFGSLAAAVANASTILSQIDKFGKRVTIREIIGAGTRLECLAAIAGCSAAYYVGAVIGSIAVATGRTMGGGTTLSDVIFAARRHQLDRPWLTVVLHRRRGVYDVTAPGRYNYRYMGHP